MTQKFMISKESLIYLFIVLVCSMIIIRDVMHISINKYIFLLVYFIFFVIFDSKHFISALSFTLPFLNGLPGNWILLIAIIVLISKKDFKLNNKKLIIPCVIIVAELVHSFGYYDSNLFDIIRYSTYIVLISFIVFDYNLSIDYKMCLSLFVLGVIFMCSIIFLTTLQYYPIETIFSGKFRYGSLNNIILHQDMVLNNDENTVGYYCTLGISVLLLLNYYKKSNKIINYTCVGVIIFFGLLTMSRAFILTTIGIFALFYILGSKNIFHSIMNVLMTVVLIIILYVTFSRFAPEIMESILNRFKETDITGGRSIIFKRYNDFLYNNLLYFIFGTGLFGINTASGIRSVPHNGFQQVFLSYGVIGFIVFIIILTLIIKSAKLRISIPYIAYVPLVCMMVYVQSIQLLNPFELMLPILIAFFSIRLFTIKAEGLI